MRLRKILRRSPEQVRFQLRLDRNVAREMHAAAQGRTLEKVAERHGTLEVRQCAVDYSEKWFKWWHDKGLVGSVLTSTHMIPGASMLPGVPSTGSKSLDLQTVTRLKYGQETGIQTRFPEVQPWLCFSLETVERSYGFICPDEYAAKCFVLALSRLCVDAKGIVATRREFTLRKARCKLIDACAKKGKTLGCIFLEAARLTASLRPRVNKATTQPLPPAHHAPENGDFALASSTPKPGSLQGLQAFLVSGSAARQAPSCRGAWPKTGETWAFTGAAAEVDVYKDREGKEWANQIKCSDKTTGRRSVTIISATVGHRFVEIRGTDKLKFVKGWIEVVDSRDTWLLEKVQTV